MKKHIYGGNIKEILAEFADEEYQKSSWIYPYKRKPNMTISFIEAANMLFDDCVVGDYLREGEILFDRATTTAFWELDAAVDAVNEFRSEAEVIVDPLMEVVRQKAAKVLALIKASDERESTVEILP